MTGLEALARSPKQRYLMAFICVLCICIAVFVGSKTKQRLVKPPASTQHIETLNVEGAVPNIGGRWNLMWKDSTRHLVQVRISVRQSGAHLAVRAEGSEGMGMRKHDWTKGVITTDRVSFTFGVGHDSNMVFSGRLQGGILSGTTSSGLPWAALTCID